MVLQNHKPNDEREFDELMHDSEGEELVISGMAGSFPESDNVYQYRNNLRDKRDMITSDYRRWKSSNPEIPQRGGKINFLEKFDSGFFGKCIHYHQIHSMDPVGRFLLERTFEAIVDAGYHPDELKGTRTGVFIAACISESEKFWFYKFLSSPNFGGNGCTRSVQAHWISHTFQFEGPSVSCDTACSSSLTAVDLACRAIKQGKCDSAIVGSGNLCLHPMSTLQFFKLGVLSTDGSCKSFDCDADGYARSEAVSVIVLQKKKDARRIYAHIVHTKTSCDGYKEQGITYPSGSDQQLLLTEFYNECNISPNSIDYLEAHATGTKVGDPEEISAMDKIYCATRKEPLYVGSVKSNHGHTEPVSGICSIIKVLLSMESDYLLPNINFIKSKFEPLVKGRMIVVTDLTPWPKEKLGLAAINNFGFGGANVHVLLKRNKKIKICNGVPEDDLPRLVCFSGRTHESIESISDDLNSRPLDYEHVRLLNEVFKKPIMGHPYRGFSILSTKKELLRSSAYNDKIGRKLYLVIGAPNEGIIKYAESMRKFSAFNNQLRRIQNLLPTSINILALVDGDWRKSNLDLFATTTFIQIALIEIFKMVGITFDSVIGHSTGNIAATYANEILTLDETLRIFCDTIKCICPYNNNNIAYRVFLRKHIIQTLLPSDFEIISHNSGQNYTILAPKDRGQQFADHLRRRGVIVQTANILESFLRNKEDISRNLVQHLGKLIETPESFVELLFNVSDPMLCFPKDSVVVHDTHIDYLPTSIALSPGSGTNEYFLTSLGRLYELGYNPKIYTLYPTIEWPVSRGTPMISPLIKWNHSDDWFVPTFQVQENVETGESSITFTPKDPDWIFITGHVIDNRNLLPATGYLLMVWETLSTLQKTSIDDFSLIFKNVRFHRATNILRNQHFKLFITIQRKLGLFGISESGEIIVSGQIYQNTQTMIDLPIYYDTKEMQLSNKDIYKELKLRGYNYSGLFNGIKSCNLSATKGIIEWNGNWTAFMDNMLQMKILGTDTRNLYVPTSIDEVSIDVNIHRKMQNKIPVYVNKDADIIKCGGVEIKGLRATPITKRKTLEEPVLETYKFIPLVGTLSLENSVRVNAQIILENNADVRFKAVELLANDKPLMPMLLEILQDQPLIQPELLIVAQSALSLDGIATTDKKPESDSHLLVITSRALTQSNIMREALDAVRNNGYVLSREKANLDLSKVEVNIITSYETEDEKLVLFQRSFYQKEFTLIDVSNSKKFEWLPKVQYAVKDNKEVLLLSQNDSSSGILGFVNCLRLEPYAQKPKCIFLMGNVQHRDMDNNFYTEQLKRGLAVNVYKDNVWGTYRHLLLEKSTVVHSEHVFNNALMRGDLSSLTWIEGPLKSSTKVAPETSIVHITYSALNFRDIMNTSGRLQPDTITTNRIEQQIMQGLEFSGKLRCGKRVMGLVRSGALANILLTSNALFTEVPKHWTYEEAATVPVTYCTTLLCLEEVGRITQGKSILIHAGTGGVGLSAINIALHYGCEIFTTVGNVEKKDYILKHFPQISETHIGHSRDTSFELMILKYTKGRGVDLILNSLAEEKLQASLRCLAPHGKFIEIGKFDLQNNSNLQKDVITHGRSFHAVMLDMFFNIIPSRMAICMKLLQRGIASGYVKPLPRRVFEKDDIQQAFRHMAAGKHIGKVLIKIRDENKLFYGLPRFYCNETYTSIIVGGLGGFGIELADWLVLRGCKKLMLVSRSGVKNGYQAFKIAHWKKYEVVTHISTADVTTEEGCVRLMDEANKLGPVECIFNLAVVLKDAILENQTEDNFKTAFAPKALATKYLDAVSRNMCPMIRKFVVFSSIVSGRGNAGQTNYGMANSAMERICENRKSDGFPALAVQWGAIGDVGLVAEMLELQQEIEIGGVLQQRISSCLTVLDTFLNQDNPIVSSMMVGEKKRNTSAFGSVIDCVMNILGIKDLKSIGEHLTLAQLGMDSIMGLEIKQTLERGYETILTPQDIRLLTFAKLKEMESEVVDSTESGISTTIDPKYELLHLFTLNVAEEAKPFQPVVRLKSSVVESVLAPVLFILPGIDNHYGGFESLAAKLLCHVFCVQYEFNHSVDSTIDHTAKCLLPYLYGYSSLSAPFVIAAYSISSVIAVHLVSLLERQGRIGQLILIDGSPQMIQKIILHLIPDIHNEQIYQSYIIAGFAKSFLTFDDTLKLKDSLLKCKDLDERVELIFRHFPKATSEFIDSKKAIIKSAYGRCSATIMYNPTFKKLKTMVTLIKASQGLLPEISHDYDMQKLCQEPVQVHTIEGNHLSILKSDGLALIVNEIVNKNQYLKDTVLEKAMLTEQRDVEIKQI
ncbi:hypothetical protein FQA39_LY16856 [Lamprigera yunnana]|nr:hypothetical protein FQA39_LY16856 [Lamprigera yunnana]